MNDISGCSNNVTRYTLCIAATAGHVTKSLQNACGMMVKKFPENNRCGCESCRYSMFTNIKSNDKIGLHNHMY